MIMSMHQHFFLKTHEHGSTFFRILRTRQQDAKKSTFLESCDLYRSQDLKKRTSLKILIARKIIKK